MNKYNEVMKKVKNKESIKAVHYVKLERDSDKCRARIMAGNGTKLCRNFLKENPNISLMEAPHIDCEFSTRNLGNRVGFANLYMRLGYGDIDVILVDDIREICSSFADTLTTVQMYDDLGAIIYDIKGGSIYKASDWESVMKLLIKRSIIGVLQINEKWRLF